MYEYGVEAPYQDLDKPWHNKLANDGATINNRLYAICSDLSYTSMTFTHTIFANLDLLAQYGHMREDLYNLVLEGKWTIDQFISMIGEMYQDTNGNGKSDTSDASAELVAWVRRCLNEAGVVWQTCELGKVDVGGGGTVAKYMANHNIDTIDIGVGVLSMHAPYEVISKVDLYEAYRAFYAFYRFE